MSFYRTKHGEYGKTWATLNENNELVICDWRQARRWLKSPEGNRRSQIKFTRIGPQKIETRFVGVSAALDGPHLFWEVRLDFVSTYPIKGQLVRVARDHPANPPFRGIYPFGTLEEALKFHEAKAKEVNQWLPSWRKMQGPVMPERAQELLAELNDWCDQKWGRQAYVARLVGASPQTVNDWINCRKKMSGEHVLRVQELLNKERRRRR